MTSDGRAISRRRFVVLAALPTALAAVLFVAAYRWSMNRGIALNRRAWEGSYRERGFEVPPSGPREGYWGTRVGPKQGHPDPAIAWCEPPVRAAGLFAFDAAGYQHWGRPEAGRQRLVLVGGSVAAGADASAIAHTYFAVLGRELERTGTPVAIDVVAAGAWKSSQELAALQRYLATHETDLVVLLDGLNDLTNGARADTLFGQPTPTRDGSPWTVLYHAHDYAARVAAYLDNVRRAAALSRRHGSPLLVVLQPSLVERRRRTSIEEILLVRSLEPHRSARDLVEGYAAMRRGLAAAQRAGELHFLDASRAFDGETATTFMDIWHFSDFGHALVGRELAAAIRPLLRERAAEGTAAAPLDGAAVVPAPP